jgi:hypothetical protein
MFKLIVTNIITLKSILLSTRQLNGLLAGHLK